MMQVIFISVLPQTPGREQQFQHGKNQSINKYLSINLKQKRMKKLILVSRSLLLIVPLFAQETPQMVTVKDTTFKQDPRLDFIKTTILPAFVNFVDEYNRNRKVAGETVLLKSETNQLVRKIEKLVSDYSLNFMEVKDASINPVEIINEFNALNAKIAELQSDPEIKYIEAMAEFKRIKERQIVLANYFNQIYPQ